MYTPTPREFLRVLVADDDDDMRELVTTTLHADGCSTVEARDGEELLDLLRTSLDEPWLRPDVLVADVKMPKLSGLGVLAALKRAKWDLPVIMITVVSDESIHTVAKRLGAVGVLHKPFDPNDLLTAVRNAKAAPRHAPLNAEDTLRQSRSVLLTTETHVPRATQPGPPAVGPPRRACER